MVVGPVLFGCGSARSGDVTAVDLMSRVHDAERRPAGSVVEVRDVTLLGRSRASLSLPPESRLTFALPIPRRAAVRGYAAVPGPSGIAVAFRVGISDDRFYQTLTEQTVTSDETAARGWIGLRADLSHFAGPQLSLFFRPDRRHWRIVVATHVIAGAPDAVYLAEPAIATDVDAARLYFKQRTQAMR
jgi:hypothetical protein